MGFQQGLSGLNLSSKGLDVVGNNIANAQTVGFKAGQAQFNDIYAAAITGSTGIAIGQGGGVMDVAQQFTQGNLSVTNNPLDISINGKGFFHFQPSRTDATPQYTRNGQLHADKDGYLVNAQNQYLCAYVSNDGKTVDQTVAVPLQLPLGQLDPKQTGWTSITSPGSGDVTVGANLDIRDQRALGATATGWTALQDWDFGSINPNMYNYSTSVNIYDQAGKSHVVTMYFVRQGDASTGATQREWAPHFILDNIYEIQNITDLGGTTGKVLQFEANGQLSSTSPNRFQIDLSNTLSSASALIVSTAASAANTATAQLIAADADPTIAAASTLVGRLSAQAVRNAVAAKGAAVMAADVGAEFATLAAASTNATMTAAIAAGMDVTATGTVATAAMNAYTASLVRSSATASGTAAAAAAAATPASATGSTQLIAAATALGTISKTAVQNAVTAFGAAVTAADITNEFNTLVAASTNASVMAAVAAGADFTAVSTALTGTALPNGASAPIVVMDLTSDLGISMFDPNIPIDFNFKKMSEFGSAYDVSTLTQDGYGPGMLSGVAVDKAGNIQGRYSNGQSKLIGQIPLTLFQNPNGLIPLGNNLWAASAASGQPLEGAPTTGSRGVIQSGSVEEANVDLTAELVNMITLQRSYQANAQTIKTQDSVLQTLVNLR